MSNTAELCARLLEHAAIHDRETSPYSPEQAAWAADLRDAAALIQAAPVVERADSATPVVERGAGNLSDNAAPVAHAEPASEPAPAPRLRWAEAPRRTEWGAGMMEALIALGVDETLRLYAHRDDVPMVDALLSAQPAPARVPLKDRLLAEAADTIEQMRETMRQVVLALHEAGHAPKHEQHVADAVRAAALAAPAVPPQKPLHIEALNDAWEDRDRDYVRCFHSFAAGVSVAERAHGILLAAAPTAQQEPKP